MTDLNLQFISMLLPERKDGIVLALRRLVPSIRVKRGHDTDSSLLPCGIYVQLDGLPEFEAPSDPTQKERGVVLMEQIAGCLLKAGQPDIPFVMVTDLSKRRSPTIFRMEASVAEA